MVEQAKHGDRESFSGLFEYYRLRIIRFFMTYATIGEADAYDLCQETFIKALGGISKLKKTESFESWLYTIARRKCLSHLARQRREKEKARGLKIEQNIMRPNMTDRHQADSEKQIVIEEVERLPNSSMKQAGLMFYLQGLDTRQIAEQMNSPVSSVTTWLDRFRVKLRRRLLTRILGLRGHGEKLP
jgi:RNA polymerase sigma-70 factor (ECF subfamily)